MPVLEHLEPKRVFGFFEELCAIPHGSGNTRAISDWLAAFATARNLEVHQDPLGNVIIVKAATPGYESAQPVILQGHMDMVCEKAPGCAKDMAREGLDLAVEGDTVYARDTTLGGDDGIAVAMALAILDDPSLHHPRVEAVFTVDEETGLLGAAGIDASPLTGRRMLNLDSEVEGVFTVSCAGGNMTRCTLPLSRAPFDGTVLTVTVGGLQGGHSGVEIDKGRANANVLMARLLSELKTHFRLLSLEGGVRDTAIAPVSNASVVTDNPKMLCEEVCALAAQYAGEYASTEPNMAVEAKCLNVQTVSALTAADTRLVCAALLALPDSVLEMSADMPGLVQTSSNFGLLKLDESELCFSNTIRSSVTAQKWWIVNKISAIAALAGGSTVTDGSYPGWAFNPNSEVKETILAAYEKLFGKKAGVEAIHAGLECGLFADSIPGLDCVAIGPDMHDVHTPRERLSISSTRRTYELLRLVLAESK